MHDVLMFMARHWFLCTLFLALAAWVIYLERHGQSGGLRWCEPQQLVALMNRQKAWVLDLRPSSEFATGHILGARSCPHDDVEQQLSQWKRHKQRPMVLVCQNGQQSLKVGAIMKKEGFEHIHALKGGLQTWRRDNMPLTTS